MFRTFFKCYSLLGRRERQFLVLVVFLSVIMSLIETVGISVIMPFIAITSKPELIETNRYYNAVYTYFGFQTHRGFLISFGAALICFYLFRGGFTLLLTYLASRFTFGQYYSFMLRLFHKYLRLPYIEFTKRNTAEMTKAIMLEMGHLSSYFQFMQMFFAELCTVSLIYVMLLIVQLKITLVFSAILCVAVLALSLISSRIVKKEGDKRHDSSLAFSRTLSETFGNFKIIKVLTNEPAMMERFAFSSKEYTRSSMIHVIIALLPRILLEAGGFVVLCGIMMAFLYFNEDIASAIPVITLYAVATARLLPSVNRIMSTHSNMLYIAKAVDLAHEELKDAGDIEVAAAEPVEFNRSIEFRNLSFSYGEKKVLNNLSLMVNKNEKVGIVGQSGGGKSTLIDLMIGIYRPESGGIFIDGVPLGRGNLKNWLTKIGYIPQSIYLFDGTVAENVFFGRKYDEARVIEVLKSAHIYDFLLTKDGINTRVGDGGIQLSGGQKQRIGIARALYSDPEIIVLDEATSALDVETEANIMREMFDIGRNKTMVIVSHRLSILESFAKIYRLEKGSIAGG